MGKSTFTELARVVLNRTSFYMWHRVECDFWTGEEELNQYEITAGASQVFVSKDFQEAQDEFARLATEAFPKFLETPAFPDGLK